MKKRTVFPPSVVVLLLLILGTMLTMSSSVTPVAFAWKSNPDLKTILPFWQGTPVDKSGRFMNHEFPGTQSFRDALKWTFQKNPQKQTKRNDNWEMIVVKDSSFIHTKEDVIVALGHATFFIRLNGKQILVDPIFRELSMHKRYTELPIDATQLKNIDYVLISHSHYDHCDKESLQTIRKQNPNTKFLAGLNMKSLLGNWLEENEIQEAGWYQQYKLDDDVAIYFLPARHSSRRSLNDVNKRLWSITEVTRDMEVILQMQESYFPILMLL